MPLVTENSSETYEQAVERTGRKYPWRTNEWPCPACGKPDCDLDAEVERRSYMYWIYRHVKDAKKPAPCKP